MSVDYTSEVLGRRVTSLRKKHTLTLDQLASMSGVSRSMLSQIERGQANPTLAVTFRIAQAFSLSIGELIDQTSQRSSIDVVHGTDPNNIFRSDDECQIRTLSPLHLEKSVEFYELRIAPHQQLRSEAHFEGARELFTVVKGKANVESGSSRCQLDTGDSAHFRADIEHAIINDSQEDLIGYLVVSYQQ